MHLFNRTYLQGQHDRAVERGVMPPFATDDLAVAVFDKLAAEFRLPVAFTTDPREVAQAPQVLGLLPTKEAGARILLRMKTASESLAANGYGPNAARLARVKHAGLYDLGARAGAVAEHFMQKAADESLTDVANNTPESAAQQDQVAALDLQNRSTGAYMVPTGDTDLPTPGVVGREVPAPGAGGTTKEAGRLADMLAAIKRAPGAVAESVGSALGTGANLARQVGSAVATNPMEYINAARGHMRDLKAWAPRAEGALEDIYEVTRPELAQRRNRALMGLGLQGAAGLVGAGTAAGLGYGAYKGIQALRGRGQPSPEELAQLAMADGGGMEVHASAQDAMNKIAAAGTFLVAMHNKVANFVPTPVALNAAVGLAEAGEQGLEVMAHLVTNVKTAEGAEDELAAVLQILQAQGIPPTPELVAALEEELGGGDDGGGAPPAGPPVGPPAGGPPSDAGPKEAGIRDIVPAAKMLRRGGKAFQEAAETVGTSAANRTRSEHLRGAAKTLGIGAAGTAAAGAAAAGAHHVLKKKDKPEGEPEGEKSAADAWWDEILKAAGGDGSLTDVTDNTQASAATQDEVAALDKKNHPEGKYQKSPGETSLNTKPGEVGAEKKAAEDAWRANIEATARTWGAKLPAAMPIEEKRAHIAKLAALAPDDRAKYVADLGTG